MTSRSITPRYPSFIIPSAPGLPGATLQPLHRRMNGARQGNLSLVRRGPPVPSVLMPRDPLLRIEREERHRGEGDVREEGLPEAPGVALVQGDSYLGRDL